MILADKIIQLRKKAGWSQEELAEKLNVTRQSVSKWEGAQSVPDMEKILQMSRIFGVTTDYLLKDELGEPEVAESTDDDKSVRRVSMEEAVEYLSLRASAAVKIAWATFLCIISPICLILLCGLSDSKVIGLNENAAAFIGLGVLILLVAGAVALYVYCGMKSSKYEFLETEVIETAYGVSGMVNERKKNYQNTYTVANIVGTVLCIVSVLPLFFSMAFGECDFLAIIMVCLLLFIVACGCVCFIIAGVKHASMQKLLQEGDYTKSYKKSGHLGETIAAVYWTVVVAGYLIYSFITSNWQFSWIIFAVSGVLYGAVSAVCATIENSRKNK